METAPKLRSVVDSDSLPLLPGPPNRRNVFAAALSSLLYVVVFGMVSSYSAPAAVDMLRPGSRFSEVTPDQIGWIASLPSLSAVFGNVAAGEYTFYHPYYYI